MTLRSNLRGEFMNPVNKEIVADYVIVGAGTAGCVLANRLSACGKYKVGG